MLFILCGPSGAGKTTLAHHLLKQHANLEFSVSYTTRAPRDGESDGIDYHFRTTDEFRVVRDAGGFAEWAEVHGNYYGTSVRAVEDAWRRGHHVVFDIDYQGAQQLREKFGRRAVVVLVVPPSLDALEARLRGRGTDSDAVIERRLQVARDEIAELERFADHRLVNADREKALEDIARIYSDSVGA